MNTELVIRNGYVEKITVDSFDDTDMPIEFEVDDGMLTVALTDPPDPQPCHLMLLKEGAILVSRVLNYFIEKGELPPLNEVNAVLAGEAVCDGQRKGGE